MPSFVGHGTHRTRGVSALQIVFVLTLSVGVFELAIQCDGQHYPVVPPDMKFVTKVFHPNVLFKDGTICLDILKKEWTPAWGLQSACRAIIALLSDPEADSPLNCDAGNMIRAGDMIAYKSMAKMYTTEHAMQAMP